MKISVFTSNQPRHLALINRLAQVSDVTFAVIESRSYLPLRKRPSSPQGNVMEEYFTQVREAENFYFGDLSFLAENVRSLSIQGGELNHLDYDQLQEGLQSDVFVVFGSSYIKGCLAKYLIERRAINIHMGLSPYYRGAACNFWALYDENPQYVGATIHLLSKGLDSGPMLYHALPRHEGEDPFKFTMKSVLVAQKSLVSRIASGEIHSFQAKKQDKRLQIRYTRADQFTDAVARSYLSRELNANDLARMLADESQQPAKLLHPYFA